MIFTVVWLPSAQDELIDIWLTSNDRQSVTEAANAIDQHLRRDAHQRGQPFFGRRILAISPLLVNFTVSLDDRLVTVAQVQSIQ